MDARIAEGLARGRVQLRAGKRAAAIATWKEAMRVAYETQHHAVAFVLSKNLGDATLETPAHEDEAVGYFDYALQLLEGCGLREDHAFYPPLENVVQYIWRRRRRAKKILEVPRSIKESRNTMLPVDAIFVAPERNNLDLDASSDQDAIDEPELCSTCGQPGSRENRIVVDTADGCSYCQACFDAYYAEANEEGASLSSRVAPDGLALEVIKGAPVQDESHEGDLSSGSGEFADHEHTDSLDDDRSEDVDPATTFMETETSSETHSVRSGVCVSIDEAVDTPTQEDSLAVKEESFIARTLPGEINSLPLSHVQEMTIIRTEAAKFVYSIEQLKSLRVVGQPSPTEVESSAVSVTNASEQTQDSRPSSSRTKKLPGKSVKRSNTETKPTARPTKAPLPQASLLPTLAECEAIRATLSSTPSPLQLASALFDAVPENPVGGVAASFVAERQLFTTGC